MTFKNHELLRGVSWDVKRGERVGLVGKTSIATTSRVNCTWPCFLVLLLTCFALQQLGLCWEAKKPAWKERCFQMQSLAIYMPDHISDINISSFYHMHVCVCMHYTDDVYA